VFLVVPSQRADLERGFIGSHGMVWLEEVVISTFVHVGPVERNMNGVAISQIVFYRQIPRLE
jgi:hypothetical protein